LVLAGGSPADTKGARPPRLVRQHAKHGYIDKTGRLAIATQFNAAGSFGDGLAAVQAGGKWFFIDKTGKEVLRFNSTQFSRLAKAWLQ
jgi:hypothetical protein